MTTCACAQCVEDEACTHENQIRENLCATLTTVSSHKICGLKTCLKWEPQASVSLLLPSQLF